MDILIKSASAINSIITFFIILLVKEFTPNVGEQYAPIISGTIIAIVIKLVGNRKVKNLEQDTNAKMADTQKTGDDHIEILSRLITSLPDGNKAKDTATEELDKAIKAKGALFEHKQNEFKESVETLARTKKYIEGSDDKIAEAMRSISEQVK
ncbi:MULTISPECIES: hypothetical protein [Klebsiella pneumoniae complex]|uniref:hypothetical protein n=1 Tax=Klebsiella pneumoniae complex TaxID=3390273 RepID=UPI001BA671D1|nr:MULTISPECIES: hypothetical protein [Klebsiella]MDU1873280.1 hypothetical protein [Escherichia coli]HBR1382483.1 hypothetical protein [Klebsiella quasipneumoniae subsp. similipneumoniae]HBT4088706.1 hypothetical protein [Klebsiella variicola]MBS2910383.1 hypothetical protein [Klebsiella pneumoniae]HBT0309511.1 hypothetical protein [Klebsiella pneumoniae]